MRCVYKGVTSTFKYGADGLRRQATVNGVTTDYVYDGQTLIREGFASGGTLSTVKATYLQGPRGSECRIDETQQTEGYYRFDAGGVVLKNAAGQPIIFARGVTKWYVYDGLGSVVGEVDPSGNLTSSPKYDVYGLVRANPGTASSAMGFVGGLGHLSEAGTGLIYMKARYYDPSLGRFVSQDTAKDGVDWFAYCDNNPVNEADSDGKMAGVIAVILLAAVASFYAYVGNIIGYDWFLDTCIDSSDPPLPRKMLTLGGSLTADITGGTIGFLLRGAMYGSGIGFAALGGALGIAAIVGFIIGFESGVIEAEIDAIDSY